MRPRDECPSSIHCVSRHEERSVLQPLPPPIDTTPSTSGCLIGQMNTHLTAAAATETAIPLAVVAARHLLMRAHLNQLWLPRLVRFDPPPPSSPAPPLVNDPPP